tara:strand:- start:248 stop:451 length:204 start_codon:yes stop_codon:yes gene_type:complete
MRKISFDSMYGCPPAPSPSLLYITLHNQFTSQMTPEAEKFNGWAAMLGFVAAFGAYATTGQIIPGIF